VHSRDRELALAQQRLQEAERVVREKHSATAVLKARVLELQETSQARTEGNCSGSETSWRHEVCPDEDLFATDADLAALYRKSDVLLRKMQWSVHWGALMNSTMNTWGWGRNCTAPPRSRTSEQLCDML